MMSHIKRMPDGFPGQRLVFLPKDVVRQCHGMPIVQDLHVLSIGSYPTAQYHYFHRPEGIPEAILIHCISGRGWCRMGGKKWPVDEGKALVIPPGQPHAYGADPRAPWTINWFHFGGKRTQAYLNMLGVTPKQPLLNLPNAPLLVQAFEEIYGMLQLGYTDVSLTALSTETVRFLGLLKVYQRSILRKRRHTEERILESMAYMRQNIEKTMTLADLARQVHLSVPHYCGMFKNHTNTSPILYLIRLKMQRACELLTATDATVCAIGQMVGYEDPYHFSRIFKKIIGLAPLDYRNSLKGGKRVARKS